MIMRLSLFVASDGIVDVDWPRENVTCTPIGLEVLFSTTYSRAHLARELGG